MGITQKIFSLSQSSKIIVLGVLFGSSVFIWGTVPQIVLADEAGYALEFDGINDYVALGDTRVR